MGFRKGAHFDCPSVNQGDEEASFFLELAGKKVNNTKIISWEGTENYGENVFAIFVQYRHNAFPGFDRRSRQNIQPDVFPSVRFFHFGNGGFQVVQFNR